MATFKSGSPLMVPHVPSADVVSGAAEILGNLVGVTCGIYHHEFANAAADGQIAVGGGVYEMTADANTTVWAPLSLSDAANSVVSSNLADGPFFGYATEALVANTVGNCLHDPRQPIAT